MLGPLRDIYGKTIQFLNTLHPLKQVYYFCWQGASIRLKVRLGRPKGGCALGSTEGLSVDLFKTVLVSQVLQSLLGLTAESSVNLSVSCIFYFSVSQDLLSIPLFDRRHSVDKLETSSLSTVLLDYVRSILGPTDGSTECWPEAFWNWFFSWISRNLLMHVT